MKLKFLSIFLVTLPFGFNASAESEGPATRPDQPSIAKSVAPEYPASARLRGIEGRVTIDCIVDAQGKVLAVGSVDKEHPELVSAALAAVQQWEFTPPTGRDETPFLVRVPINFELEPNVQTINTMNIAAR